MNYFYTKKAFTLVELMAVVAIVAIIAGIGIGSYRKAADRAIFSDGLTGASTLSSAYDEYYYDHNYTYPTSMNAVAVSLTKASYNAGTNSLSTRYFTFSRSGNTIKATRNGGNYSISAPLEATNTLGVISCTGEDSAGEGIEFCKSMGYASCSGATCIK